MCGISGYVSLHGSPVDQKMVERMVAALAHRGPDCRTTHFEGPVGFGHARLSIIDLEKGQQPLFNEDRTVAVICNGEIYNYRELRVELERNGHRFRTNSDCETLAHLWEESGSEMLGRLRGMFAFVLYDTNQQVVFGARDRFGQKPLYYLYDSDRFAFASEIKSLLTIPDLSRDLDPLALDQYLFHQFVPQPHTMFASIKKLNAGSCFQLSLPAIGTGSSDRLVALSENGAASRSHVTPTQLRGATSFEIWPYWQPRFVPDNTRSDDEHLQRVEEGLIDAVRSHMVSDVPVGVFLSGGIDSSLLTALASRFNNEPLQTFSISFPGSKHDEAPYARAVAATFKTNHRDFPFEPGDARQFLLQAAKLFDQPLADTAVLPLMSLSRAASAFVKVVLTGDGGDELFAGYRKYLRAVRIPGRIGWLSRATARAFPISDIAACGSDPMGMRKIRCRIATTISARCRSEYNRQGWEGWERYSLYQPELNVAIDGRFASWHDSTGNMDEPDEPLNAALLADQGPMLGDRLLLKADYATMAYGLEGRAPLLDHQLAQIAGELPLHLKATGAETKVALRWIAAKLLPAEIVSRRKKGFSMPIDRWFRNELREWTRSCLLDDSVSLSRFFQRSAIEQLLKEHLSGKNHSMRIYTLVMFELWCRLYL